MTTQRKGGHFISRKKRFARIRIGKKERFSVLLPTCTTDEAAATRAAIVSDIVNILLAGGRRHDVRDIARKVGAAKTAHEIKVYRGLAESLVTSGPPIADDAETFSKFAERWTTGALHRAYPDHVRFKRSAQNDVKILKNHINPIVGDVPLMAFKLEHAEAVMRAIPRERGPATRRHIAQVLQKVLRMAVYPAKVLAVSPLPAGFLPKLGPGKAMNYLYPDEDARLLACTEVPIVFRMFYGFLAREGMRPDEALSLEWSDLDLERGAVKLDENKTDDPRAWALNPATLAALRVWAEFWAPASPFGEAKAHHPAETFREHLHLAGVARAELFTNTAARRQIRLHDHRGTFVTVALANGKTESWVQDRTGHKSTLMIAKYRRASRTVTELKLGELLALDAAIPELRGGGQRVGSKSGGSVGARDQKRSQKQVGGPSGGRTRTPFRAEDFKFGEAPAGGRKRGGKAHLSLVKAPRDRAAAHAAAHPTPLAKAAAGLAIEVATWDVFDVFTAEQMGVELPKRGGR